jgi:acetyl esterase/lipase
MKLQKLGSLCVLLLLGNNIWAQSTPAESAKPSRPKWSKVLPETPQGYDVVEEVVAVRAEEEVKMWVYVPRKPGRYPAVLDIHGGGWQARQVDSDRPLMERLAARGFVTALVAYRLSGTAPYPAALHDCKAAVRHLRANAERFRLDPERLGVIGGSAGGHLSGLLAMTGGLPEFEGPGPNLGFSSAVKACVVMAATQDLVAANREKTTANASAFFGGTAEERPETYREASPITHVRAGVPPVVFIEGAKDTLKIGRAEMQEKLRNLGVETDLFTLEEAPHPFWMSQPWLDQSVEIAFSFFNRHLGGPEF